MLFRWIIVIWLLGGSGALGLMAQDSALRAQDTTGWSFFDGQLQVGGWFDFWLDDLEGQEQFNEVSHAFLFADGQLSERWRFFLEGAFQQSPTKGDDGATQIQRLYAQYQPSRGLRLRMGRFNTPSGLWKEKHWHIMVDANRKPLMADLEYLPMQAMGLELAGTGLTSQGSWEYAVFVADSENRDRDRSPGFGGDLSFNFAERLKTGLFFYDYQNSGESTDPLPGQRRALLSYAEGWLVPHLFLLRAEHLSLDREDGQTVDGYYGKIKWQMHRQVFLNYRFDNTEDASDGIARDRRGHTLTLGYWPLNRLRTRLEFSRGRLEDADWIHEWSAWLGFIF